VVDDGLFALVASSVRGLIDVVDLNKAASVDRPLVRVKHY